MPLSSRRKHGKSRQIVANETRKLRASDQARAAGISQAMRYDCGARKRPTPELCAIPTILVTAYPDEMVRDQALKDGVACYLSKPVDDEELERCLRSALKRDTWNKENS